MPHKTTGEKFATPSSENTSDLSRAIALALRKSNYQTWQTLSAGFTIGRPALQENACENSGMFTSTPLIRYFAGECGSVMARTRRSSGRSLAQSRWANPMKKRCSE